MVALSLPKSLVAHPTVKQHHAIMTSAQLQSLRLPHRHFRRWSLWTRCSRVSLQCLAGVGTPAVSATGAVECSTNQLLCTVTTMDVAGP